MNRLAIPAAVPAAVPAASTAALAATLVAAFLSCLAAPDVEAATLELPFQIGGAYNVPVKSIREERFASTVHQQYDFSCGSAALSTLLTYQYNYPVTEDKVFEEMFRRGDQAKIRVEGFSLLDMKRYLEAHGFQADGFQESLDKLAAVHIPAIVLVNENGYHHFVVVKGVRDGRVLIGDPSGGTRAVTRAAFEAAWVNHILFVITNQQKTARFNAAADWQAAPAFPLAEGISRTGLAGIVMPKLGPTDF
ncbi:MAG: C39 family peptidase [Burkholderiales bacterium]|nr:C39 family peptidase [Burkholderiales bacterium]